MSNPLDPSKVAEVARGLTADQRAWLLAADPTLERVAKEPCEEWWDHPEHLHVEIAGVDYWLATRGMHSPAGLSSFIDGWEQLKPLALAVRAYLERTK
jgi:hypothetical protein